MSAAVAAHRARRRTAAAAAPATAKLAILSALVLTMALAPSYGAIVSTPLGPAVSVLPVDGDPDWHIPYAPALDAPVHPDYVALAAALERYRALEAAGGWSVVPAGATLSVGMRDARVVELRARLRIEGDYDFEMGADPWFFDLGIDRGVRRVQRRHLLDENGILDEPTLAALNLPVGELIARLEATLERWRWLPRELGARYAWVNVPRARLDVIENGSSTLVMRVVVGHKNRATPSLAGELGRVVFNPTWAVPAKIAIEDLLPQQQQDAEFFARHRMTVSTGSGTPVDARTVDWSSLGAGRFPYRITQAAGPGNSLGRIKIAFENPYDIYLHDTPSRGLFGLSTRTLSSGCVRLEDAPALATLLLANDRTWQATDTALRLQTNETRTVNMTRKLPIYIVYMTVWPEADGELRFGRDLYERDVRLVKALREARANVVVIDEDAPSNR